MDVAHAFIASALEVLYPILDRSGYVLYSDAKSLKPCPVYLLGHNPGGSPIDQATATIRASLDTLPSKAINNYLDEAWTTASGRSWPRGQAPLQRRVVWMLGQLGLDPRKVPCSNLIFARSVDVSGSAFLQLSDLCWRVHAELLQVVRPKLLLVFGNSEPSPYTYLREKWSGSSEATIDSGHGNWLCRSFRGPNEFTVVGIPHLSRYNIIGKSAVMNWIREQAAL